MKYLCLLRGINVGGKNKVSMAELKAGLAAIGFSDVSTYINSGNVMLSSSDTREVVQQKIEELLPTLFKLDTEIIKICALTKPELKHIVTQAPAHFGIQPELYHSDVLFPMGVSSKDIMAATEQREGVDAAWEANGVVYYQRLSSERTKSKLSKVISKPIYKNITIRSWSTTTKLLALM